MKIYLACTVRGDRGGVLAAAPSVSGFRATGTTCSRPTCWPTTSRRRSRRSPSVTSSVVISRG
jgi:hypothetical protein